MLNPRITRWSNKLGLHPLQVLALAQDTYDYNQAGDISNTSLVKNPRMRELALRHQDEIIRDVSENAWAFFGTSVHQGLDSHFRELPGAVVETREQYRVPVDELPAGLRKLWLKRCKEQDRTDTDIIVPARADLLLPAMKDPSEWDEPPAVFTYPEYVHWWVQQLRWDPFDPNNEHDQPRWIIDHKVTRSYAVKRSIQEGVGAAWSVQMNQERAIFQAQGWDIESAWLMCFCRDWEERNEDDWPNCPFATFQIPPENHEALMSRLQLRVIEHVEALFMASEVKLPECTYDERYQKPDQWVIYHPTGGRAIPNGRFTNREEAEATWRQLQQEQGPDAWPYPEPQRHIDQPKRCLTYCDVSSFCSQFAELKKMRKAEKAWKEQYQEECRRRRTDRSPEQAPDSASSHDQMSAALAALEGDADELTLVDIPPIGEMTQPPHAAWTVEGVKPGRILIRDCGDHTVRKTVNNDAEWVIEKLMPYLPPDWRVLYRDSEGQIDELLIKDGKFAGFKPGPRKGKK